MEIRSICDKDCNQKEIIQWRSEGVARVILDPLDEWRSIGCRVVYFISFSLTLSGSTFTQNEACYGCCCVSDAWDRNSRTGTKVMLMSSNSLEHSYQEKTSTNIMSD